MLGNKYVFMFYSAPDFSDNSYHLYKYMEDTLDPGKFTYVWLVQEDAVFDDTETTKFIKVGEGNYNSVLNNVLKLVDVTFTSHTNHNAAKTRFSDGHVVINLTHACGGKGVKIVKDILKCPSDTFDYLVHTGGPAAFEYVKQHYFIEEDERLLPLGYPRNDALYKASVEKPVSPATILWAPTFRQTRRKTLNEDYFRNETGMPLLNTYDDFRDVDDFLRGIGVHVDLKLHRLQKNLEVHRFIRDELTNIRFINEFDRDFYTVMPEYSALLTDYSSIYVDFLLLNRPEAFIFSVIKAYAASRGAFQYDIEGTAPGCKIYSIPDLKRFCRDVGEGVDPCAGMREAFIKNFFLQVDGKASERITSFVLTEVLKL